MILRWLPPILLIALAVASGWLLQRFTAGGLGEDPNARHTPDMFMTDFVSVSMGEDGLPAEELRAARLEHFPDTDTHELVEPYLLLHKEGDTPTEVRSERGWVSAAQDVVLLQGRVYIWRDDDLGHRKLEVLTRDLLVRMDDEYAETEAAALIRTPSGESRSVGLKAFLDRNRLELISQVQSSYDPKKR